MILVGVWTTPSRRVWRRTTWRSSCSPLSLKIASHLWKGTCPWLPEDSLGLEIRTIDRDHQGVASEAL